MENATKALLIAGALLLTIAIIAIGMMIYTQSQSIVTDVPLDSFTIASHNNRFLVYTGKPQKGSSIMGVPAETLAYNKSLTNELMRVSIFLELPKAGGGTGYDYYPLLLTERTLMSGDEYDGTAYPYKLTAGSTTTATYSDKNDTLIEENVDLIVATEQYKLVAVYDASGYIIKIRIKPN